MIANQLLNGGNDLRKKIEDYSYGLRDIIGRGYSSVVYRGANDRLKEKVAIKVIDLKSITGKPAKKMLQGEIEALKRLNHPNILKCHDIFSTANNCYIITEFCNEGDLEHLLKKRTQLGEEEAIPIMRQILSGFVHIANNGFLHRDLKPANILLRDHTVKIADFGFAKKASGLAKETVNVGSPLYMSPEALQGNVYTVKNDIWSIGVIFYEILHGRAPWKCSSEQQLIEEIKKNSISILRQFSEDLKDFIRKCLIPDERRRLGITELTQHPFYTRLVESAPLLLRKGTSFNENNNEHQNNTKQPDPTPESTNKPKILHHRQHHTNTTPEKQLQTQLNWMRFLHRFHLMFPDMKVEVKGRYTLGLRFIALKQMFGQLEALEKSLEGDNPFGIEGWQEFLRTFSDKDKYNKSLAEYRKTYEGTRKQFKEWINFVSKDKTLSCIADDNLSRSEYLSMTGLAFAVDQAKVIWQDLGKIKSNTQSGELPQKNQDDALRLDFTLTYYQLNSLLVDNFYDPEYFARMSKLETTLQCRPVSLEYAHLPLIENKLKYLQLVK